ncbi:MAG: right-handed parallel beta-helix repeat-containing protein, partial [Myxococcota bacterium]|nr:right-handed parallel beta-helix repeat-containing protein [Myxococcota bacterium]
MYPFIPLAWSLLTACGSDPEPLTCGEGELLDGETCVPEACGTGTWGNLETDPDTVYVDASAEAGGDGSEDRPFTVIQEGLDAQDDKAMVAVAAGTYVENLLLGRDQSGVHLAGRCRALVSLDGSQGSAEDDEGGAGLYLDGGLTSSWAVSGLTVTGAARAGLYQLGGRVTVEEVDFTQNGRFGLLLLSGQAEVRAARVHDNQRGGVGAAGHTVTLDQVEVLRSRAEAGGQWGRGIEVTTGSVLTVTDSTVANNEDVGIYLVESEATLVDSELHDNANVGLFGSESTVQMQGCRVFDEEDRGSSWNRGINVQDSTLVATDSTLESVNGGALSSYDSSVTLEGFDVLDARYGAGIYFDGFGQLSATGCLVQGNDGAGLTLRESQAVLTGCLFQENREAGLTITGGQATLDACEIGDTRPGDSGQGGFGIWASESDLVALDTRL